MSTSKAASAAQKRSSACNVRADSFDWTIALIKVGRPKTKNNARDPQAFPAEVGLDQTPSRAYWATAMNRDIDSKLLRIKPNGGDPK